MPEAKLADPMAEAVKAVEDVFKRHGMSKPAVVINAAWSMPSGFTAVVGTKVPRRHRAMLAESLAESASEAEES